MTVQQHCPRCEQPLPARFLGGLCPRCLAKVISASYLGTNEGRTFGEYELLEEIGRGGMGVVYKARQVSLNRTVAIKMMLGGHLASDSEIERFHAEAEAVARLEHPNIVAIHEIGAHEGQPWFSMQWIDGSSLAHELSNLKLEISNREAAELLAKVARAVHHAHQRGLLHRDLKPANILLDTQGEPHVSDFGLARNLTVENHMTMPGSVLGSPSFMAPEQAAGKTEQLTTSVDVYSLGAILYFVLTGQPPFPQVTPLEAIRSVLEKEPVRPTLINRKVDRDLETICLKCLEKDPQRRYSSADALAEDLERWLRHEPIHARPANLAEQIVKWARRKPALASLIGAVLLMAAIGFTGIVWQLRQTENARRRATRAELAAVQELYASYLAQAQANRWSGQPGRRFNSLEALRKAAAIRPSLELRNEAIACLALPDVRVERQLKGAAAIALGGLAFDSGLERYAQALPDGSISVRQAANDRELFGLPGPGKPVWAGLYFSPNGRYLAERYAGPATNQILVWDLSLRKMHFSEPMDVRSLCFRPDSEELVVSEENGWIHFFDLSLGREVRRQKVAPILQAIAYDPTGKRLAVTRYDNPTVLIINPISGQIEQRFDHPAAIGLVGWSRDGTLLACPAANGRTYLRNIGTGQLETVLEGHMGVVNAALFNPQGDLLLTSGWDGTTRFWDVKLALPLVTVPGGWVPIAFGCEDRVGFGITEVEAGIWQVESARECRRLGRTGQLWSAQFSPDNRLLATASSDGLRIWRVEENELLTNLPVQECRSALFTADARNLICSGWSGLQLWPLQSLASAGPRCFGPATSFFSSILEKACLAPDGRTLIAACRQNSDLVEFDLKTGSSKPIAGHAMADSVTISPDGKWFATGTWKGENVKVWELATGQPVWELVVKGNAVPLFSPDGEWLVTGSEVEYRFWKVPSWEPGLAIARDRVGDVYGAMAFSPDARMLALLRGRNSDVRLVSMPEGRELAALDTGQPLCFSYDGRFLATAGQDFRSVLVWDLRLVRKRLAHLKLDW